MITRKQIAEYAAVLLVVCAVLCLASRSSGGSHAPDQIALLEEWAAMPTITQAEVDEMRADQIAEANVVRKANGLPPLSAKYLDEWRLHDLPTH